MTDEHTHYHKLAAQRDNNLYYECACGSRRYGIGQGKKHRPIDTAWLAGEKPGSPE